MFGLESVFNLFSLFYVFLGLRLSLTIWREWADIRREPLTPRKKSLAEQASFLIAMPIGIFLHELAHALAVLGFGGEVVEFRYFVFWGYVRPDRIFPPFQEWFISLAGTLGSLLFGVAIWLLLQRSRSTSLRFFGLRAFRFQVYYSLIYYPVFTLLGFVGDWRTIYNFGATPLWSGLTAVAHAALLLLFWQGDRRGWFEMEAVRSLADKEKLAALAAEAAQNPHQADAQMRYIDSLRRSGATNKAKYLLENYIEQNPNDGTAHLELALLQSSGRQQIPVGAVRNAEEALRLGLPHAGGRSLADSLLAQYNLDLGRLDKAENHVAQALAQANAAADFDSMQLARLHHLRSQIYRRQQQFGKALPEVRRALQLAEAAENEQAIDFYRRDLEVLTNHANEHSG